LIVDRWHKGFLKKDHLLCKHWRVPLPGRRRLRGCSENLIEPKVLMSTRLLRTAQVFDDAGRLTTFCTTGDGATQKQRFTSDGAE